MKYTTAATLCIAALAGMALAGCQSTPPSAGSGFLSSYGRLVKQGPMREPYLGYSDPAEAGLKIQSLHLLPVTRFPAQARFDGVDEAVVSELLAHADRQLRAQLGTRVRLAAAPEAADATLQVALTGVAAQPEGKTALDLIPLRLITGPIKDAALGKPLEAAATLELRLSAAGAPLPLRESLYQLNGKGIGRADDAKTRVTADALKPAIDSWANSVANQIAAKR